MPISNADRKFDFKAAALPPTTFGVVSFNGHEAISAPYHFEIALISREMNIDLFAAVGSEAVLTIQTNDDPVVFNGVLTSLDQMQGVDGLAVYQAVLAPRLKLLEYVRHNQVFLNQTIPQILEAVLKADKFTALDYEFRIRGAYNPLEYVCQYAESDLAFMSQRMERDGIYYFFDQGGENEKLVITDNLGFHDKFVSTPMNFLPPSGLNDSVRESSVHSFRCRQNIMPATVVLKDYNYRTPSLELLAQAPVSPKGMGEVYIYAEHFQTPEAGAILAKIRAEELVSRQRLFYGESLTPLLRSGYLFDLAGHFRDDFNITYLVTEVEHSGSQAGLLTAGIREALSIREEKPYYRNSFTAIPGNVQFRPERKTPKSRFSGTMNAVIDAEGSGQYAELDDQGRYKVKLPFDLSGTPGGKASSWLRKAEPYGGDGHGMHFPLHKGCEVILTFIDGDPDRPIIAAAVPNPTHQSMVTGENQTMSVIQTGAKNKIAIEDLQGSERILMLSPHANTWLRMGAPNDPDPGEAESGFRIHTEDEYVANIGSNFTKQIMGNSIEVLVGAAEEVTIGARSDILLGAETAVLIGLATEISFAGKVTIEGGTAWEYNNSRTYNLSPMSDLIGSQQVSIRAGGQLPHFWKIGAAAVSAALALSATAAASGKASEVGHIVGGIVAGLSAVLGAYLVKTHASLDTSNFASQIELNNAGIEMKCQTLGITAGTKVEMSSMNFDFTAKDKTEITLDATDAFNTYQQTVVKPIQDVYKNAMTQYAVDMQNWNTGKMQAQSTVATYKTWLQNNPAPVQPVMGAIPPPPNTHKLELTAKSIASIEMSSETEIEISADKGVSIGLPKANPQTTKVEFLPSKIEMVTSDEIAIAAKTVCIGKATAQGAPHQDVTKIELLSKEFEWTGQTFQAGPAKNLKIKADGKIELN